MVPSASASSEMSSSPGGTDNSALVKQCLEFCQTLASMGQTINLSLTIGLNFSFSLNTNKGITILDSRKAETEKTIVKEVRKLTPSARRRNQKRRKEFLKRKSASFVATADTDAFEKGTFMCDQCEKVSHSENGLKIHKGKVHKSSILPSLEVLRDTCEFTKPLEVSPLMEVREDLCGDLDKKHEEQGKSKVSLNPEQRAMFGQMFKMYQTQNVPKS